ncbi:MAG: hypothetical protein J7K40_07645 [candidate division Zixibacteria bacterium]|nr:hypothetical protein [candidate division Zixibacteria bacterium]
MEVIENINDEVAKAVSYYWNTRKIQYGRSGSDPPRRGKTRHYNYMY